MLICLLCQLIVKSSSYHQGVYSPDTFKTVKYPIVNYISAHRLSPARQAFVSQMSAINIPTKVQEALLDSKCADAMTEEMKTLEKKN